MIASVAGRSSLAPTATVGPNLYATAAVSPKIMEIGVFNTTATAMAVGLARATTAGTRGAALTSVSESDTSQTVNGSGAQVHTVAPTVGATFRQASLGAAIGSGVIWTFSEQGLVIPTGTANGIVIICPTGTGQIIDFHIVWRE